MAKRKRTAARTAPRAGSTTRPSRTTPPQTSSPTSWIAIALALITLIVYWRATSCGFVTFDDPDYIYENKTVLRGLTMDGLRWAFGDAPAGSEHDGGLLWKHNWHPLTWISHMADVTLFDADAGQHHFVSIAIHAVSSSLLFIVLARLTGAAWPSAVAAALFALHPLHVESVAWLSERKDVLSGLFWNLSLLMYVRYLERRTRTAYLALIAVFAAALLSKQMVVTLPFVLLLLDWWPRRRIVDGTSFRESLIEKVPLFAMSAIASAVIFTVQRGTPMSALSAIPVIIRLENAALSYVRYLGRMLWPSSLAIFYPYEQSMPVGLAAGAAILIVAITITAWVLRSKAPYLLVGWLWYLGTLVPVIGIVQVGQQSHADRYTYLPLVGIFIAVAWAVYEFAAGKPSRIRAITAAAAAVLVALSAVTWHQLGYWRNGETLFAHAIEVTGDNAVAECDLGMALNLQQRSREAIPHFERAVRIDPKYVDAWANLGNALARNSRVDEATVAWRSAIQYNPALPDVRNNLGVAYMRSGNLPQAVEQFKRAVDTDPRFVPALMNLGRVAMQSGDSVAARGYFARVREIDPGNEEAASALAAAP